MFRITLDTISRKHMFEREDRYGVMVNGRQVDELYFNLSGYRGALMTPHGSRFDVGERGISTWRKLAADINREAKALDRIVSLSEMKFSSIQPTVDGDVVKLDFHSDNQVQETIYVTRKAAQAGLELLGYDGLCPEFFPVEDRHDAKAAPESERICGWQDNVGNTRFVLDVFETDDPEVLGIAVGYVPSLSLKLAQDGAFGTDWDCNDLKTHFGRDWSDGVDRMVFVDKDVFKDLKGRHERSFMKASHLPGRGILSAYGEVFSPMVTSSGQRPSMKMNAEDLEMYREVITASALRIAPAHEEQAPEFT